MILNGLLSANCLIHRGVLFDRGAGFVNKDLQSWVILGGFYCLRQENVVKKIVNFANWRCESGGFLR